MFAVVEKNGLAVTQVSPDNLSITVQGATYDVERALGVTLNDYNSVAYGKFVANDRNPIVPSSLPIGSVSDISAATTIPPSSLHSRGEQSLRQDATIRPFASAPQTTPTQCSLVQRQDPNNHTCYGPRDLATAYDATSLGNASGETIAIIANDWTNPLSQTVFDNFQAGFNNVGLNGDAGPRLVETAPFMLNGSSDQRAAPEPGDNKIEYVFDYGFFTPQMEFNGDHPQFTTPIDPGDNEEAVMVEYAHGLAPGAGIEVYMAGKGFGPPYSNPGNAIQVALRDPKIAVIALDTAFYGGDLTDDSPNPGNNYSLTVYNSALQEAAAMGRTVINAEPTCDACVTSLQPPYFPSASPYVLALGQTTLFTNRDMTWAAEQAGPWSIGGCLTGGAGKYASYYPEPVWQKRFGVQGLQSSPDSDPKKVQACTGRAVPDISIDTDQCTGPNVYGGTFNPNAPVDGYKGGWQAYRNGSAAGGIAAGLMGTLDHYLRQHGEGGIGFISPHLYQLASNPTLYQRDFHDITTETLQSAAVQSATPSCDNSVPEGLPVSKGWDNRTGLGSIDVANLAHDWINSSPNPLGSSWTIGGSARSTVNLSEPSGEGTDGSGQGWLRLTDFGANYQGEPYQKECDPPSLNSYVPPYVGECTSGRDEVGYALYNRKLTPRPGTTAHLAFDYACWGGAAGHNLPYPQGPGGDGLSLFAVDASAVKDPAYFVPGGSGSSLGYIGMPGGYLGLGFDEYVNYSTAPNTIALRGPAPDYNLVEVPTLGGPNRPVVSSPVVPALCNSGAATRPTSYGDGYNRIAIDITPDGTLTVSLVNSPGRFGFLVPLQEFKLPAPPTSFYIGFAAATGLATDAHEIRNVSLTFSTPSVFNGKIDPVTGGYLGGYISCDFGGPCYNESVSVAIPAQAFDTATTITGSAVIDTPDAPSGSSLVGSAIDLTAVDDSGTPVTTFKKPLTLTFGYPSTLSDSDAARLYVAYYDTATDAWTPLPASSVDTVHHQISAQTDHFTLFGVFLGAPVDETSTPTVTPGSPTTTDTVPPATATTTPANSTVTASGTPTAAGPATSTAVATGAATDTAGPTGTGTPNPTDTATSAAPPSATSSATTTSTANPTETPAATSTTTPTSTATGTSTSEPTSTGTASPTGTSTSSVSLTATPTGTPTGITSSTATVVATPAPTGTSTTVPPPTTATPTPVCELYVLPAFTSVPQGSGQAILFTAAPGSPITATVMTRSTYPTKATLYTTDTDNRIDLAGHLTANGTGYRYAFAADSRGFALLIFNVPRKAPARTVTVRVTAQEPCGTFRTAASFQVVRYGHGNANSALISGARRGQVVALRIVLPQGYSVPTARGMRRGRARLTIKTTTYKRSVTRTMIFTYRMK